MLWKKFNALGSEMILTVDLELATEKILEQAEQAVINFERQFSRFSSDSELSRFNRSVGSEFAASKLFIELVETAKSFYEQTAGVFDPTVISSLEAVGYDQNFTDISQTKTKSGAQPDLEEIKAAFLNRPKFSDLTIVGHKLLKPAGFRMDLGGLGKGFVSDWLSRTIFAGLSNYWLSAGGDLLIKGHDQTGSGWKIGIDDPSQPGRQQYAIQTAGESLGIATSGVFKRQGSQDGFKWHHLIDPRNGLPVENNLLAVTAISASAAEADVYAKTVLILGEEAGLKFIEAKSNSACIIFYKSGGIKFSTRAMKYIRTYETGI